MNKIKKATILAAASSILFACAPTTSSKISYVNPETSAPMSLAIEYQDFERAAQKLINKLMNSPLMQHCGGPNGRCVFAVATIKNDTTQHIDMDQLMSDIKSALLQSGKAVISAAVSTTDKDEMLMEIRKLRNNPEFNAKTAPGKGQLILPQYLLSGKIIQRVYRSGDKKKVDYYFILKVLDANTGLELWEGKEVIGKVGSKNDYSW